MIHGIRTDNLVHTNPTRQFLMLRSSHGCALNPEGSQPLAGGRRRRTTGIPGKTHLHPGGMPDKLPLASLRDAISTNPGFRWCRFTQPPANRGEPSGLNRNCATSNLTPRASASSRLRIGVDVSERRGASRRSCSHPVLPAASATSLKQRRMRRGVLPSIGFCSA